MMPSLHGKKKPSLHAQPAYEERSTITSTRLDSPLTRPSQNDSEADSFTELNLHSNTSLTSSTTSQLSTRLVYLPSPPRTPEQASTIPKPEARTSVPDLSRLPVFSEGPTSRPLPEEDITQITNYPTGSSVTEATTSKSVASNRASPESSFKDSIQSNLEEISLPSPDIPVTWRSILFKSKILASKRRYRALARDTRIDSLIRLIKQVRGGTHSGTQLLIRRKLNPSEYRDLLARIEVDEELDGFFNDQLRFEYSYTDKKFTIHMPNVVHAAFAGEVDHEIRNFLKECASSVNENITAKIASDIKATRDGEIAPSNPKYEGKGPDASFQLQGCDYPGLIVEVAWSQNQSKLKEKAKYYFESTRGGVRTVICFNLNDIFKKQQAAERKWAKNEEKLREEEKKKKKKKKKGNLSSSSEPLTFLAPTATATSASFSVWRAENGTVGKDSFHDQIFRFPNQQHNPEVSLKLSLKDFLCESAVRQLYPEIDMLQKIEYPQLEISSKMLCNWFNGAVEIYRPQWKRNLERTARRRQETKDTKSANLRKEAAALKKEEARGSTGRHRRQILDAMRRVLRSGSYKQREKV